MFAREPRAPGEDALPFRVWDGARLVPVGEYLAANPRPDLLDRNGVGHDDLISVWFTATDDIHAMFPAEAARKVAMALLKHPWINSAWMEDKIRQYTVSHVAVAVAVTVAAGAAAGGAGVTAAHEPDQPVGGFHEERLRFRRRAG